MQHEGMHHHHMHITEDGDAEMSRRRIILNCILIFLSVIILIILTAFAVRLIKGDSREVSEANLINDLDGDTLNRPGNVDDISQNEMTDSKSQTDNGNGYGADMHGKDGNFMNRDGDNLPRDGIDYANGSGITDNEKPESTTDFAKDKEDPQQDSSEGMAMDVRDIKKSKHETDEITFGIDVSKWQGIIDWKKVKDAGVEFAIIRVGYRTQVDGKIIEDPYAKYNLQQAQKNGIKLGAYFFSTAVSEKEAEEEAKWVVDFIAPYKITYPVVYNCEGFTDPENRQYGMTREERTRLVTVFLDYIEDSGYTPMFYAAKNELEGSRDWDTSSLTKNYKIWVAQYTDYIDLDNPKSFYSGPLDMWQYTSNGSVPGIDGPVDLNVAYFGYKKEAKPKDNTPVEEVTADPAALINFTEVNESVTAKEVTNLRNIPSLDKDSKVVEVLYYGDIATRTGIGDNGWSRVEYKGKTLYAVSSYLTTDINYKENSKPTIENPEAGITFTEVNEKVTAKIKTNLRLVPSTESDETIATTIEHGDIVTRTGVGSNGWSRVEYKGQILYAVTSYLEVVEDE